MCMYAHAKNNGVSCAFECCYWKTYCVLCGYKTIELWLILGSHLQHVTVIIKILNNNYEKTLTSCERAPKTTQKVVE